MSFLPVPHTRTGWMFSIAVIVFSFVIYYVFIFDFLSNQYSQNFWESGVSNYTTTQGSMAMDVRIPRYISTFVSREMAVHIENTSKDPIGVRLVIVAGQIMGNDSCPSKENFTPVLFCSTPDGSSTGCSEGKNVIEFDEIPARGQAVKTIWVIGDSGLVDQTPKLDKITFGFWAEQYTSTLPQILSAIETAIIFPPLSVSATALPQKDNASPTQQITLTVIRGTQTSVPSTLAPTLSPTATPFYPQKGCLSLTGNATVHFEPIPTFAQSFLRILLLPPWANGLIPAFVLFVVHLTEHKIQPRPNRKNGNGTLILFVSAKKYLSGHSEQANTIHCSKNFAWALVFMLYLGLMTTVFSIPVMISYFYRFGADIRAYIWLIPVVIGLLLSVCLTILIIQCEGKDLKDNDPIYPVQPSPAEPTKVESNVADTLNKINTSLTKISANPRTSSLPKDLTKKIQAGFADLAGVKENLALIGNAGEESKTHLSAIQKTLGKMSAAFDKLIYASPTDSARITAYRFDIQTILSDKAAAKLLEDALITTSREEFDVFLKEDPDFALRILALLAHKGKQVDDLQVGGDKVLDVLVANKAVFDQWLDQFPVEHLQKIMVVLLTKKRTLAEKYLFEIILKKCNIAQVIPLLSQYITQKRENGEFTGIRQDDILHYLISRNDIPKRFSDDLKTVLFLNDNQSLLSYARQVVPPLSLEEFRKLHDTFLLILCILPPNLFLLVAKEIFESYKGDKSVSSETILGQFVKEYRSHQDDNNLANMQNFWCNRNPANQRKVRKTGS